MLDTILRLAERESLAMRGGIEYIGGSKAIGGGGLHVRELK